MQGSQLGLIRFNTIESISAFASNLQNEGSWFASKLTPEQISMVISDSYSKQVFFQMWLSVTGISGFKSQTRNKAGPHPKNHLNSAELRSHVLSLPSSFSQEFSRNGSTNTIKTVQSMKPVECVKKKKKSFRSLFIHLVDMIACLLKRNQRIIIPITWPYSMPTGESINCALVYCIYLSIVQGQ